MFDWRLGDGGCRTLSKIKPCPYANTRTMGIQTVREKPLRKENFKFVNKSIYLNPIIAWHIQ